MTDRCFVILSLFPGIGLLDMAFELEWPDASIVRGPDLLWGGDIRRFHAVPGRFDGVIGGPPCKPFSKMARIAWARGIPPRQPNLIPEFERVVEEAQPEWFLMENVPQAPEPHVSGYLVQSVLLSPHWMGEEQSRLRRFSFGTRDGRSLDLGPYLTPIGVPATPEHAVTCTTGAIKLNGSRRPKSAASLERIKAARRRSIERCCELQGLPSSFLHDAPFTVAGKREVIGNGVPLPMGCAIARAIRRALEMVE